MGYAADIANAQRTFITTSDTIESVDSYFTECYLMESNIDYDLRQAGGSVYATFNDELFPHVMGMVVADCGGKATYVVGGPCMMDQIEYLQEKYEDLC